MKTVDVKGKPFNVRQELLIGVLAVPGVVFLVVQTAPPPAIS